MRKARSRGPGCVRYEASATAFEHSLARTCSSLVRRIRICLATSFILSSQSVPHIALHFKHPSSRDEPSPVATMVNLVFPLLLSLAASGVNGASSLPKPSFGPSMPMNLSDLYSSIANTTSLGDGDAGGIDPRFGVDYLFGDIPLRPIACLVNAVSAMSNLALQDFGGNVRPIVARLPNYPDVVIRSDAPTLSPGLTPTRYILWGIWSFALFMMKHDRFQTMHLALGFNGVTVGYIRVEKPRAQVLSLAGRTDGSGAEGFNPRSDVALSAPPPSDTLENITWTSNGTSLSLANTTTPSDAGDLRVFINFFGQRLTNRDFFIPILAGLDYVARFPSTSPVDGFKLHPTDSDTWIEFRDYGSQPRTEAPFFEYQWVARAFAALAEQMAVLGGGREAIIVMQVDGVNVGDGWIRKG